MPIMPQIAMGFQPPQFQAPQTANTLALISQLENQRQENQLRQAQALKLQRDQERENALIQSMQGGKPLSWEQAVAGGKFGTDIYTAQQAELERRQKRQTERQMALAEGLYAVHQDPSQENIGRVYGRLQERGMGEGLADSVVQLLFASPDERKNAVMQYIQTTPGMAARIDEIVKRQAETAKLGAETDKIAVEARTAGQPKPTADMQNYQLAVSQGFPGSFVDYKSQLAKAGRSEVNVPVTIGEKDQTGWIDLLRKEAEQLRGTAGFVRSLESARALIPSATVGAGAGAITNIANFARNRLGIEIDPKTVTSEELRSQLFQGIIANLRQIDAQPTQSQQAALQQAIGTIGSDPKALDNVLTFWSNLARDRVNEFNRKVDETQAGGFKLPYNPRIKLPERASTVSPRDQEALTWARSNRSDPRAAEILKRLGVAE